MDSLTNTRNVVTTFAIFDDLVALLQGSKHPVGRKASLTPAEIATIALIRTEYGIRTWKGLYKLLKQKYDSDFSLPVYKNFVALMNQTAPTIIILLNILLQVNHKRLGVVKLVDSTPLPVCKNMRIPRHKTCQRIASRSKGTMGWFYGMKLHVMTDLQGSLLMIQFTTARVDDRYILDQFLDKLHHSIVIADAGYCSKPLENKAAQHSNVLLTCQRRTTKRLARFADICLLHLRLRVETVFSVLKERLGLVSSLPRSEKGYLAHYIYVIFGYIGGKVIS